MTLLRFLARLGLGGAALASSAFTADYEVNQTGDSGSGSLRSALALANANPGADRILIHSAGPIVLSSGPVPVTDSVEILGTGAEPAVLAGNGLGRLLLIEGDGNEACRVDVRLARLHLRDLNRALQELPHDQREALVLVCATGLSYEEAADVCQVAVGTIKSRIARARDRLIELLGEGAAHVTDQIPSDKTQGNGGPRATARAKAS